MTYESSNNIIRYLKRQLAGMITESLVGKRKTRQKSKGIRINAYKLFFFSMQKGLSFSSLSRRCGLDRKLLRELEKINKNVDALDTRLFRLCDKDVVRQLEEALECPQTIQAGGQKDFLSLYIHYYATYKGRTRSIPRSAIFERGLFPAKALVFDFDGTLTQTEDQTTTWEKIWMALGYDVNECANYHRQFSEKRITHSKWCDITCQKFRAARLTESKLLEITDSIKLISGAAETLNELHRNGIKLYILSGSIRQVIKQTLGELYGLFEDVKANDLFFDKSGLIKTIKGTQFDFKGKAKYLTQVLKETQIDPLEMLFVGNSCNDVCASQSGARTLCVNPHFTDPNVVEHWTYCLRKMDNLHSILEYVRVS